MDCHIASLHRLINDDRVTASELSFMSNYSVTRAWIDTKMADSFDVPIIYPSWFPNFNALQELYPQLRTVQANDFKEYLSVIHERLARGSVVTAIDRYHLDYIKPDVCTICIGQAASMGAFLLSCGAQGKRYALPNSRIMIHQPLGGARGQATDIEIQAKEILRMKEILNAILAKNTGQKLAKIQKDTDRDFFMSSAEAKEYGLIDKVLEKSFK